MQKRFSRAVGSDLHVLPSPHSTALFIAHLTALLTAVLATLPLADRASAAEPLGRLFFTPAERALLNRQSDAEAPPAPPPRLDGIITRSDGPPTLFVDGRARLADPRQVHIDEARAEVSGADGRRHRPRVGDPPAEADTR